MGFSNQERINMNSKALAAAVIDANPVAQWYETRNPFAFMLNGSKILTNLGSVPVAANLTAARNNATANPALISDLSQVGDAVRLTAVPGTNNTTWIAYSVYNDASSTLLDNWIQPQMVLQSSGAASIGYSIILYDGDPNAGGTEVTTTDGTTGTGASKSVGWIWNYANGLLLLSDDFKSSVSDPYVLGFRYIGSTANDSAATSSTVEVTLTADEAISIGDIVRLVLNSEGGGLTAGRAVKAIATNPNSDDVYIAKTAAAAQGNTFTAVMTGNINVQVGSGLAATNNGASLFLSGSVAGRATLTPPSASGSTVVRLGKLTGANGSTSTPTMLFRPETLVQIG